MAILRNEALASIDSPLNKKWVKNVERFSELCASGISKTHIAFLGTAMLAKSIDKKADLYAIKPKHSIKNKNAFSARTLCHSVLVPIAAELGISLGVTGREPLNNQPYFRMTRLGDATPVHAKGRPAFDYMLSLIDELSNLTEAESRQALRAFIAVRRKYQPRYGSHEGKVIVAPERLALIITEFVRKNSEGGRLAQAIVAGLLDVFAGTGRVESGRINDPSRKYPGDVCIRMAEAPEKWEKAIEVRHKLVSVSDVQIFAKKCVDMGVREAAVVMVGEGQTPLDDQSVSTWASGFGIGLTLFYGWMMVVDQVLFWAELPKPDAAAAAIERIEERLIAVEASASAVALWQSLSREALEVPEA